MRRHIFQWGWLGMIPVWVLVWACASTRPADSVVVSAPFSSAGKSVLIIPFTISPGIATDVNQMPVAQLGEILAYEIQNSLKKAGFPHPLVVYPGKKFSGDLLIQGRISRVSGGNRGDRMFFEHFGFGASEVLVTGEVIDLHSSQSVLGFGLSAGSNLSWRGNEATVRHNLQEIAEKIARAVTRQTLGRQKETQSHLD